MMSAIGIGNLASGYGGMSLNFANQRAQNAWNAANMRSGAALGRAGATAGMIGSALQGFNSQEGMSFEGLGGLFRTSKPALNPSGLYQYRPNQYSGL
jgi:hypothetical protein